MSASKSMTSYKKGVICMKNIFSSKVYDILKWCVMVFIPALTVAYVGLSKTWHWPLAKEVAETSAVVCTMLGTLLGISNLQYKIDKAGEENEQA